MKIKIKQLFDEITKQKVYPLTTLKAVRDPSTKKSLAELLLVGDDVGETQDTPTKDADTLGGKYRASDIDKSMTYDEDESTEVVEDVKIVDADRLGGKYTTNDIDVIKQDINGLNSSLSHYNEETDSLDIYQNGIIIGSLFCGFKFDGNYIVCGDIPSLAESAIGYNTKLAENTSVTKMDGYIKLASTVTKSNRAVLGGSKLFDLSRYSKMCVDGYSTADNRTHFGIYNSATLPNDADICTNFGTLGTSRSVVKIDISTQIGDCIPVISTSYNSVAYIYNVWFE